MGILSRKAPFGFQSAGQLAFYSQAMYLNGIAWLEHWITMTGRLPLSLHNLFSTPFLFRIQAEVNLILHEKLVVALY